MGCTFCATGSMGFKNNLSSGEIVEQLVHASRLSPIRNIVFMVFSSFLLSSRTHNFPYTLNVVASTYVTIYGQGMGEPFNNYTALVEAIRAMTAFPFQLSPRKITVSTVCTIVLVVISKNCFNFLDWHYMPTVNFINSFLMFLNMLHIFRVWKRPFSIMIRNCNLAIENYK